MRELRSVASVLRVTGRTNDPDAGTAHCVCRFTNREPLKYARQAPDLGRKVAPGRRTTSAAIAAAVSRGAVRRQFFYEAGLMDLARRRARELCRRAKGEPRFCIGTLKFGDHPVLCRGRVSPGPCDPRIGSQQIRRRAVLRPFSDGRQTVPIREQSGMSGSLPQCMVQNTGSQCTACLRQSDRWPPAIRTGYKSR
jgi:hypothetical protein